MAQHLIAYERWLRERVGASWRGECHRRMPRPKQLRTPGQPELLAESWAQTAAALASHTSALNNSATPYASPSILSA
jgi:hypothetical protein